MSEAAGTRCRDRRAAGSRSSRPRAWSSASAASAPSNGGDDARSQEGSITALIGPNGAGKTTFFNLITGFYRPDGGAATLRRRRDPAAGRRTRSPGAGMVRTFQITKALAAMPVIDNMMLAAPDQPGEQLRNVVFRPGRLAPARAEVHEEAMELLEVFNLTKLADDYAGHALGRPAQAARAGAGADGEAALPAPRRADGRHQPDPRAPAARPHAAPARRGRGDLPVHRARHGGGDEPLRPGRS